MTQHQSSTNPSSRIEEEERAKDPDVGRMRVIVPLQGVVQGRSGFVVGSVIPCALFYFLQLYLKRRRRRSSSSSSLAQNEENAATSSSPAVPFPSHSVRRRPSRIPPAPPFVSPRALNVADGDNSPYYRGWKAYQENPYHASSNRDGIIQMGLADNQLSLDLIEDWLKLHLEVSSPEANDDTSLNLRGIAGYQDYYGTEALRIGLSSFMGRVMNASIDPSRIVLTAGATAAIESLGFCLAEHGNAFLVPTPYYAGFDRDLKWRAGVELIPVPCRSADSFHVTVPALDRAFTQAKKRGFSVRALLITNPSNPVGNLMDSGMLSELLDFAIEKNIHLICDEVYAASVYESPDFKSIASILESGDFDRSRVHIIYGLSKDLSLPGFRVGVLYSYNDKVIEAAKKMTRFCSISSQTQNLLSSMLSDNEFIEKYISENKKRLKQRSNRLLEDLEKAGVRYIRSNAGLYCWVDLTNFMPSFNERGELILWEKLLLEAKINVTPGSAFHCIEPGWFRFCFATLNDDEMSVAIQQIQDFFSQCKNSLKR
eukprot:TRINITY_DN15297_c0_g1_i1.p1 TRINITY_DN15297_c0_g1~~TRINITY_DN15297_c0_g1_i1.p1  ORF type:complete len:541 (+),score=112.52 TRINITY_DN15297_c0_g1_i1:445-2067(+)